ncbi:hypothetical protein TIFTF001_015858 [Ficus carica]|uniref:Uncharacterized protein n=1 Tax=Ficus carica TaxID=3494 RepID=A0AA87ZZD4_FICCA|nr:hypothetical protein TIFTF001_015858 [Ficus carica]
MTHFKSLDLERTPSPPLETFVPVSLWVARDGTVPDRRGRRSSGTMEGT